MRARKVTHNHEQAESQRSPGESRPESRLSPRRSAGLDPKSLANLKVGDHADRDGLLLRVTSAGARSWMLRYRVKVGTKRGAQHRLRLGDLGGPLTLDVNALGLGADFKAPGELTLKGARDVATALSGLAARGVDPLVLLADADRRRKEAEAEAKLRATEGTSTLATLVDAFLAARRESVRPNTYALWESIARAEIKPTLGDRDPRTITRRDVKAWHATIGETGRRTWANRCVEMLAAVYTWAIEAERLEASPVTNTRKFVFTETSRDRVLSSDEIKAVWDAIGFEPYGDVLRMLLWTAARRSEVLGLCWNEVDFNAKTWRLPAERSKTGVPRTIPLAAGPLACLQGRRAADPKCRWVFASPRAATGPLASIQSTFRRVAAKSGVTGWCVHDIRRTVRVNLADLSVPPHVSEAVLGHARSKAVAVYHPAKYEPIPEMRAALEAWARRLHALVTGEPKSATVLPFTG